jgi:hypothetical protein
MKRVDSAANLFGLYINRATHAMDTARAQRMLRCILFVEASDGPI